LGAICASGWTPVNKNQRLVLELLEDPILNEKLLITTKFGQKNILEIEGGKMTETDADIEDEDALEVIPEEDNDKENKLASKLDELEYQEWALALKEHELALREWEGYTVLFQKFFRFV